MEEDAKVPIILARPFLATIGAVIDITKGNVTFEVGDKKMEYTLTNSMRSPSIGESIYRLDVLDEVIKVKTLGIKLDDPLLQTFPMDNVDEEGWVTK